MRKFSFPINPIRTIVKQWYKITC